jgi:nucleotide-binding universal stress UspA family protein
MYQRVLFATDGSAFAEAALADAIEMARMAAGEMRVVTVVEAPAFHGTPEATVLYETEMYKSLVEELEKIARAAVERAAYHARARGVQCSTAIRHGLPADEILAEAKDWRADAIVLATHGRSGLGRLFVGSVASKVVHHATCPVLLHRAAPTE